MQVIPEGKSFDDTLQKSFLRVCVQIEIAGTMPALAEFAMRGFLPRLLMCEHGTVGLYIVNGFDRGSECYMLVCYGIVLFKID